MKNVYPKQKELNTQWRGNRIVGCQSDNHSACYGELWECRRCHKIVCYQEGTEDLPEICDNCWSDIRVLGHKYSIGVVSAWKIEYSR